MSKLGGAPRTRSTGEMWWWLLPGVLTVVVLVLYLFSLRRTYCIKGKHIVITGGSSGIGKALAAEALSRGASAVVLLARNKERLQTAKDELDKLVGPNQRVYLVSADVGSLAVKDAVQEVVRQMGHVDVLVNCAGTFHTAPLHETPPEKYEEILRVNVLGSVYLTQAMLPIMMERKVGKIVFISSMAGQLGLYGYTAYAASKFALRGLAETLQMEVKPYNIAVSISFPPDTDTPQLQAELPQRSAIAAELASYGSVFQAEQVAGDVWRGVERGRFQITHGFDGFLMGTVTAGMAPVGSMWEGLVQAVTMSMFRAVALVYLALFNRVVSRGLQQNKKSQ